MLGVDYDVKRKLKLVLSIIGETKNYVPRVWPKSVLQRALIETCQNSGGGTYLHISFIDAACQKCMPK